MQVKSLYRARKDPAEEHMTKFTLRHWQWWHSLPENASSDKDAPGSDGLTRPYRAIETIRQANGFSFVSNATCSCNNMVKSQVVYKKHGQCRRAVDTVEKAAMGHGVSSSPLPA
jgi:hypothetical protein